MSLRIRLALLTTTAFVVTLAVGTFVVADCTRRTVAEETQSAAALALQFLELAYAAFTSIDRETLRQPCYQLFVGLDSIGSFQGPRPNPLWGAPRIHGEIV